MRFLIAFTFLLIGTLGVYAQGVTQDDVDVIASRMFCPVCENEPLDQCYNATCIQWKREIRDLLAQGMSENEIITSFVDRYGEHVVGVPQDPFLRMLSFGAPIIGTLIAVVIGLMTFMRWRQNVPVVEATNEDNQPNNVDSYRSQIERDLA